LRLYRDLRNRDSPSLILAVTCACRITLLQGRRCQQDSPRWCRYGLVFTPWVTSDSRLSCPSIQPLVGRIAVDRFMETANAIPQKQTLRNGKSQDWIEHPSFGLGQASESREGMLDIAFLNHGRRTLLQSTELQSAASPNSDFKFPRAQRVFPHLVQVAIHPPAHLQSCRSYLMRGINVQFRQCTSAASARAEASTTTSREATVGDFRNSRIAGTPWFGNLG